MQEFKHYPVMLNEAVDALDCSDGKLYIDGTLGGGGYSELILKKISPNGRLISFDVDIDAINASKERLKDYITEHYQVKDSQSILWERNAKKDLILVYKKH